MNKEIENGKAWIQLAQMILIFSGFLFTISAISYTNSVTVLSTSLPIIISQSQYIVKLDLSNLSQDKINLLNQTIELNNIYLDTIKPQTDLMKISFAGGSLSALFSLVIWGFGYFLIMKSKEERLK